MFRSHSGILSNSSERASGLRAMPDAPVRRPAAFSQDWWQERGLTAMLVSLVLALFVGGPLMAIESVGPLPFDIFFTLLLLSGVVAFSRRRWLAIAISVIGLVVLDLRWSGYGESNEQRLALWDNLLSMLMLAILTGLVLEHVFRKGPITADRIRGAVAAYLLLGLVWAFAYALVDRFVPGGINLERAVFLRASQDAELRVLQLRDPDDGGLRGHHAGPSGRPRAGDRRSPRRAAVPGDPDRSPRVAADRLAPAGRSEIEFPP